MKKIYLLFFASCFIGLHVFGQGTIAFTDSFTTGSAPTTQRTNWESFCGSLDAYFYTGLNINGTYDPTGYTCTSGAAVAAIADALKNGTTTSQVSDGHTWNIGIGCTSPPAAARELYLDGGSCSCTSTVSVRPSINNANWGGVSTTTCLGDIPSNPTQRMTVTFTTTIGYENGSTQNITACSGTAYSLDALLAAVDPPGSIDTWTVSGVPSNGVLSGFSANSASGMNVVPTGTSYTPNSGFSGTDAFTIQVSNGVTTALTTINVTVNPTPDVNAVAGQAVCNAASSTAINFSGTVPGASYDWMNSDALIGLVASGSGDIASFTATNGSNVPVVAVFTVTPTYLGCTGASQVFNITVNPTPAADPVISQTICNGWSSSAVSFTGSVAGATYDWTNSDPSIGLASSGTGDIAPFSATNTTGVPVVATLTVTPSYQSCMGTAQTFSITVNPTPDVNTVPDQAVCNGSATMDINFTGTIPGTTYDWMNSDPTIGIGAAGSGDILAFIAMNGDTALPVVAVLTVTPTYLGCTGASQMFSLTVNPTPSVHATLNQAFCNGETTGTFSFTGPVAGTAFTWTNTDNTIGIASSGSGDILPFAAANTTTDPVSAFITVSSSANGCTGTSNSFTIIVNPTPMLSSATTAPDICDGAMFNYTPMSLTGGTTFDWSRAAVSGISNAAGAGTDDPAEVLMNTTANPLSVVYSYTLTANSCANVQNVTVNVKPTPVLTSVLTPPAICDNTVFHYLPASLTAGTSYAWDRATVTGISNPAGSGADSVNETLVNITPDPVAVMYVFTLTADGCTNVQNIPVTVNPKPLLSTLTTLSPVCNGSHVFYGPASLTAGTNFMWSRAALANLTNPAATGIDTVSETLNDTSAFPVNVIYVYTLTANGCSNSQNVGIVVYPTPTLSSTLTPGAVCDGDLFNYTPMSRTVGTGFEWSRSFVLGIGLVAGSGSGNPNEQLINNTNGKLGVVYVYTLTANGCMNTQNVTVTVNPTPRLSSGLSYRVCSGTNFHYVPTGFVSGTSFAWTRVHVAGIVPANKSGSGVIDEVLTDSLAAPTGTSYVFTLLANGCTHVQAITLTVDPTPAAGNITTAPPHELCTNTMYQNFGSNMPPAGQDYHWTAQNATVWATGAHGQYALVNFTTPGTAMVTLVSNLTGSRCVTNNTYTVTVGSGISDAPQVVYFNGQLICKQADEDSYQWGYDDDVTLDSTLIAGENNPNYFISGPDFSGRHYWVITRLGDCMQKSYYNAPTGITNVHADNTEMKVYPNPAKEFVNVEINTSAAGNFEVQVYNMMGQSVGVAGMNGHKATVNIAGLPSGVYLVDCFNNGVKVATQRFTKN